MPTRSCTVPLTVAAGSATTNFELPPIDISNSDICRVRIVTATIGTDAGDTYNWYFQSRAEDGTWDDRIAFTQLIGTAADAEILDGVIQQFGGFSDDEEESEPTGSAGAARLTTGTVRNGIFPPVYRGSVTGGVGPTNTPGASWRLQCVAVDASANGFFTGTAYVSYNSAF